MNITSPAFADGNSIPSKYTCDGENARIPLEFVDIPSNAKSLVLICDDPDIPQFVKDKFGIEKYDHWVVFNIPPETKQFDGNVGVLGKNSAGNAAYTGPCPPDKEHRYFFYLYALDRMLDLKKGVTKQEVLSAMKDHVIAQAQLVGRYERISA